MSVEVAETVSSDSWFHILMIIWLKKWLLCLLVERYMGSFNECPLVPECKGCAETGKGVFREVFFLLKPCHPFSFGMSVLAASNDVVLLCMEIYPCC